MAAVLREAFPECGGFFDEIGIVARLGPVESGFEQPQVTDAMPAAIPLDLIGFHG
jgi:hypothetical protein